MKRVFKVVLATILLIFVFCGFYFLFQYFSFDPKDIKFHTTSTKVLDKEGQLLYEISKDNAVKNTPIEYSALPQHCVDALVATEDKTFWNNIGVDLNGTIRLGISIATLNSYSSGGSTISQQVIKLSDLSIYNRTPIDKLNEIPKALKLNQYYSKEDIILMYFNNAYFGNLNYGIESASQDYFDKQTKDLSIAECTYLVGLPQAPSIYNPYGDLNAGRSRQKLVLESMFRDGYISEAQINGIFNTSLEFKLNNFEVRAPHFIQFLQDNLEIKTDNTAKFIDMDDSLEAIDWSQSYSVDTYYDYSLHSALINKLNEFVIQYQDKNLNNASAFVIGKNNEVVTMIGSINFFDDSIDGKFNSSTGFRQPGNLYIPIVYSFGLEKGYLLSDTINNAPFTMNVKSGQNSQFEKVEVNNSKKTSPMSFSTIESAIKNNLNIPATMIIQGKTPEEFKDYLKTLPISMGSKNQLESFRNYCNEILTQEGCEVSLMDLVILYNGLKNNGNFKSLKFIKEVKTLNGNVVWQQDLNLDPVDRLNEESFTLVNSLLERNSNSWFWLEGRVRNNKDYMLIGFNENYTIGIWLGNTKGNELLSYDTIKLPVENIEELFLNMIN